MLALAGGIASGHDLAEAAENAGCPAVVPVGGVFGCWPFGEVGPAPELVEPGQFPESFWMASRKVATCRGTEHLSSHHSAHQPRARFRRPPRRDSSSASLT